MITKQVLEQQLQNSFDDAHVCVETDGYHYLIEIQSDDFKGLNKVKRQQAVYKALNEHITSGALHAVTINAFSKGEQNLKAK